MLSFSKVQFLISSIVIIENSFVILVLSAEPPLALLRGGTDTKM